MKKNNKYNYIQGKQITDHESGTRVYDIDNYRLPSVTTILGATKNKPIIISFLILLGSPLPLYDCVLLQSQPVF